MEISPDSQILVERTLFLVLVLTRPEVFQRLAQAAALLTLEESFISA